MLLWLHTATTHRIEEPLAFVEQLAKCMQEML